MVNNKKKITCVDRDGKEYEVGMDKLKLRVGVYGILIEDGKILLSKQWDGYDFPGGGVEIDESIDKALEREFWEETGLKIKRGEIVAGESSFYKTISGKFLKSFLIYYIVEKISGKLTSKNLDEHEKEYVDVPEWIILKDVGKVKFYNSIDSLKIIKRAKKIYAEKS